MFLETQRLILREFASTDFADVHAYSSDYETVRHMMFGPNTPEQTRSYLDEKCVQEREAIPRMHYNIAIEVKELKKVVGGISLHLNWRRDDGILGLVLHRIHSGKGYMSEALAGVLEIAFTQLGLHRVHAICDVENIGAQKVLERVGMRREGLMVGRGKHRPEEKEPYFDQYGYGILVQEWKENDQK